MISLAVSMIAAVSLPIIIPFGAFDLLYNGILPILEVEVMDVHALALLLADQNAVEVCDFPKFRLHHFPRTVDEFEFSEEFLVLNAMLLVVFQEVHRFLDFHSVLGEKHLEVVQINEPFIGVLDRSIFTFAANCLIEVEAVHVAVGTGEIALVEFD
jgi:hypothetical protein